MHPGKETVVTRIAAVMLNQIPTVQDLLGIALVMTGIAVHRPVGSAET